MWGITQRKDGLMAIARLEHNLKHFFLQRHLPRARHPVGDDIWDWDCGLAEGSAELAEKIREHHFPHFRPTMVLHSAVPRAKETAEMMWGGMPIRLDGRLGPSFIEAMPGGDWRNVANMPATASGEEIWRAAPSLIEQAGINAGQAVLEVLQVPDGMAAWGVSHCPIVDACFALAMRSLTHKLTWLPGQVASGGVVHFKFKESKLVEAEYYAPPT